MSMLASTIRVGSNRAGALVLRSNRLNPRFVRGNWPFRLYTARTAIQNAAVQESIARTSYPGHSAGLHPQRTGSHGRVELLPNSQRKNDGKVYSIIGDDRSLHVKVNGTVQSFDPLFLRDAYPYSGQKKFNTSDLSPTIYFKQANQTSDGMISISWGNDLPEALTHHQTSFSPSFFQRQADINLRSPKPEVIPWAATDMQRILKKTDHDTFMGSKHAFKDVIVQLERYGLAILSGVPQVEKAVEDICATIGPVKGTFYGHTFDVKDKPRAENVAYTSGHLALHMDLLYMRNPPGLQLLHCLETSTTGGESIFSDAMHAASLLERASPEAFDLLSTFPVTYEYHKGGHHYVDSKPVFELDPYREHESPQPPSSYPGHPSNQSTTHKLITPKSPSQSCIPSILNINWGPPFQGPLRIDIGQSDNGRRLRAWHDAARAFDRAINDSASLLTLRLDVGDCVIFNNRRVLHGRTAYSSHLAAGQGLSAPDERVRWLKGAYVDMDDFLSKARTVREERYVD